MRRALLAAGLVAASLAPALSPSEFYVNVATQTLIAAIFALSLDLLVGYAGLVSLGHAAYLGVGAYLTVWLATRAGLGALPAAAAAVALTTAMAALFGLFALRATGLGFLMITLALGQILWGLAYRWVAVTGGDNGLSGLARPQPFGLDLTSPRAFYLAALAVFALAAALLAVFVVAGFWGGVAGVLYAFYNQFVSPHVLALTSSAEALLMVIAGGAGTLVGPIVGAGVVLLLKNVVSAYVTRWVMLLGVVFVAIVVLVPEGVVPGLARLRARRRPAVAR